MAIVTLISPSTTENIGRHTPIVVRVQTDNVHPAFIWAEYDYGTEVIHSTGGYSRKFVAQSSKGAGNDITYTIVRSGGWLKDPTIRVDVDEGGA